MPPQAKSRTIATYRFTRAILDELNGEMIEPKSLLESLAITPGAIAFDGFVHIALGVAAIAETVALPVELLIDGYNFVHDRSRRK